MENKVLLQITELAEIKEQSVKRFDSLCGKYMVSIFDKALFVAAMLYYRMNTYESLCNKYKIAEYDRNNLAGALITALTARNSIGMGRLITK